jgi:hypothetical protein
MAEVAKLHLNQYMPASECVKACCKHASNSLTASLSQACLSHDQHAQANRMRQCGEISERAESHHTGLHCCMKERIHVHQQTRQTHHHLESHPPTAHALVWLQACTACSRQSIWARPLALLMHSRMIFAVECNLPPWHGGPSWAVESIKAPPSGSSHSMLGDNGYVGFPA